MHSLWALCSGRCLVVSFDTTQCARAKKWEIGENNENNSYSTKFAWTSFFHLITWKLEKWCTIVKGTIFSPSLESTWNWINSMRITYWLGFKKAIIKRMGIEIHLVHVNVLLIWKKNTLSIEYHDQIICIVHRILSWMYNIHILYSILMNSVYIN